MKGYLEKALTKLIFWAVMKQDLKGWENSPVGLDTIKRNFIE